ncbi:conserved protein, unknown function, partial [Hepatocystis sp. ex Piliocolobus tephrosceles]
MTKTEKTNKRKLKEDICEKNEYETKDKKSKKKSKVEKKSVYAKLHNNLNIHNNIFIKLQKENKINYEKKINLEKLYNNIKGNIISLNISDILIEYYESFFEFEKNKIDFILPELDKIINSSNIDILKDLCSNSFYPIYHDELRKDIIEWLSKDRQTNKQNTDQAEHINISYFFSLNILLTYMIYKNDDYSNCSCLIYLNMLQWVHTTTKRQQFRMFILKGILKRFLACSFYFNDKEITKHKKVDNENVLNDDEALILKNIFLLLYESLEYLDITNFTNINDKNCIFELIKFFIELIKKPLLHSVHILCINYLIQIIKKCYDYRLCYNINVELYDIGPCVNIFVKVVNLIFAKLLCVFKDIKNEEHIYSIDEINNINNLVMLFFVNVINNFVRILIPQVLFNEKLKHDYLTCNEMENTKKIKN